MTRRLTLLLTLFLTPACTTLPLKPAPQNLQPWTTILRDQQPEGPFAAVYRVGARHLVFIGAQHENQNDSPAFQMIRDGYTSFKFDTVIAEGFPTSWGANPARIVEMVAKTKIGADGFVEGGETVPTFIGAQQQAARLFGGEPDDLEVKKLVSTEDVTDTDLLGFYVLRNLPQWMGEREIKDTADSRLPSLVEAALVRQRDRLQIPTTTLADYASWLAWYETTNRKPLNASFDTEEVGPLVDGRFGTNKIAYAVSRARDAYLHRLIVDRLNAGENLLVVFGGSHLMIHRPALDTVLGRPCFTGADLKRAPMSCRTDNRR